MDPDHTVRLGPATSVESWASSAGSRATMRANRGRDTKPEIAVRRIVHASGYRYRVNARPEKDLRRTADLFFSRVKVAVFIDGCFWHGCPDHYIPPKANDGYWSEKVSRNHARDIETRAILEERGWEVLRFWEHEPAQYVASKVMRTVDDRRSINGP